MAIMSYLLANHLQEALIVHLLVRDVFAVTQHSPLLNGRKGRNSSHDGDGNHGPENGRHGQEKQEAGQLVGYGMREAEPFEDSPGRYLIDNLDNDDDSGPDPKPQRNRQDRQQPNGATGHE